MKKIDIGKTITVLANIAVLLTLVALVFEIRTNTAAIQASSVQLSVTAGREYLTNIALSEELSRIRQAGGADLEQLTESEAYRFDLLSRGNWLYFQNLWIQRNLGVLDQRAWESNHRVICSFFAQLGWRQDWHNHKAVLDPEFIALVEGCPGLDQP